MRKRSTSSICLSSQFPPGGPMTAFRLEYKSWGGLLRRRWFWPPRKLSRKLFTQTRLYNPHNLWMGVDYGTSFNSRFSVFRVHCDRVAGNRGESDQDRAASDSDAGRALRQVR